MNQDNTSKLLEFYTEKEIEELLSNKEKMIAEIISLNMKIDGYQYEAQYGDR